MTATAIKPGRVSGLLYVAIFLLLCTGSGTIKHFISLELGYQGWQCLKHDQSFDALALFDQADYFEADNMNCNYGRALILYQLSNYDEALNAINKTLTKYPGCAKYLGLRAELYCRMRDYNAALRDYARLVAINPSYYNLRAGVYETMGDHINALKDYQSALDRNAGEQTHHYRADIFMHLEKYEQAAKEYTLELNFYKKLELKLNTISEVTGIVIGHIYDQRALANERLNHPAAAIQDRERARLLRQFGRSNNLRYGHSVFTQTEIKKYTPR